MNALKRVFSWSHCDNCFSRNRPGHEFFSQQAVLESASIRRPNSDYNTEPVTVHRNFTTTCHVPSQTASNGSQLSWDLPAILSPETIEYSTQCPSLHFKALSQVNNINKIIIIIRGFDKDFRNGIGSRTNIFKFI